VIDTATTTELAHQISRLPDAEAWCLFVQRFPVVTAIAAHFAAAIREESNQHTEQK
jgi:hypothetical protein